MALHAYENHSSDAPEVWQLAHSAAIDPHITALQKLLLGVNAHINYDLVLTVASQLLGLGKCSVHQCHGKALNHSIIPSPVLNNVKEQRGI